MSCGKLRHPDKLRHYTRSDVSREWRHLRSSAIDLISHWHAFALRCSPKNQLCRLILLRLEQNQTNKSANNSIRLESERLRTSTKSLQPLGSVMPRFFGLTKGFMARAVVQFSSK